MMRGMALALHVDDFFISPYAFSAFVALVEKGLPHRLVPVALQRRAQREPAFREHSVTGRVPLLEHDGFFLSESSAIVEYIEETFPEGPTLLPRTPRDRARARQIMA